MSKLGLQHFCPPFLPTSTQQLVYACTQKGATPRFETTSCKVYTSTPPPAPLSQTLKLLQPPMPHSLPASRFGFKRVQQPVVLPPPPSIQTSVLVFMLIAKPTARYQRTQPPTTNPQTSNLNPQTIDVTILMRAQVLAATMLRFACGHETPANRAPHRLDLPLQPQRLTMQHLDGEELGRKVATRIPETISSSKRAKLVDFYHPGTASAFQSSPAGCEGW